MIVQWKRAIHRRKWLTMARKNIESTSKVCSSCSSSHPNRSIHRMPKTNAIQRVNRSTHSNTKKNEFNFFRTLLSSGNSMIDQIIYSSVELNAFYCFVLRWKRFTWLHSVNIDCTSFIRYKDLYKTKKCVGWFFFFKCYLWFAQWFSSNLQTVRADLPLHLLYRWKG